MAMQKRILFIHPGNIHAGMVEIAQKPTLIRDNIYPWTPANLAQVLIEIKKSLGDTLRIGLDESFVYSTSFLIPVHTLDPRTLVHDKARYIVPESLDQLIWDIRDIPTPETLLTQGNKLVLLSAVTKSFSDMFSKSASTAQINIEAMEPITHAAARLLMTYKEPLLMVHVDSNVTLSVVYKGLPVTTETVKQFNKTVSKRFIDFFRDKYNFIPLKLVFTGNTNGINPSVYSQPGLPAEVQGINAMIGLAVKDDIRGPDMNVLNLTFQNRRPLVTKPAKQESNTFSTPDTLDQPAVFVANPSNSKRDNIIVIVAILVIVISAIILVFNFRK